MQRLAWLDLQIIRAKMGLRSGALLWGVVQAAISLTAGWLSALWSVAEDAAIGSATDEVPISYLRAIDGIGVWLITGLAVTFGYLIKTTGNAVKVSFLTQPIALVLTLGPTGCFRFRRRRSASTLRLPRSRHRSSQVAPI